MFYAGWTWVVAGQVRTVSHADPTIKRLKHIKTWNVSSSSLFGYWAEDFHLSGIDLQLLEALNIKKGGLNAS